MPSAGQLGVAARDLGILDPQQPGRPLDLGDLDTQRAEDVGELARDEAATDDRHPPRQLVHPHDGVAGVHAALRVDPVESVDVEQVGARPGGDDDAVGGDLLTGRQRKATLADETGRRGIHGHEVLAAPVALAARGDLVDPVGEDAVADRRPVDADVAADRHAEALRPRATR